MTASKRGVPESEVILATRVARAKDTERFAIFSTSGEEERHGRHCDPTFHVTTPRLPSLLLLTCWFVPRDVARVPEQQAAVETNITSSWPMPLPSRKVVTLSIATVGRPSARDTPPHSP